VITYRVSHQTLYSYANEVVSSHNVAHLLPRPRETQTSCGLQLRIEPTPDSVCWHRDYFGNDVVFFALQAPHRELMIHTEGEVVVDPPPIFDATRSRPWEEVVETVRRERTPVALEAFEYVFDSPFVAASDALADYARPSFPPGRSLAEALLDFSHRIHTEFHYDPGSTTLDTLVEDALRARHGVCQDYAHVMIGGLRSLGLPARYVSGYLGSRPVAAAGGKARPDPLRAKPPRSRGGTAEARAPELIGAEASHAWVAAWCPTLGWIEVDPTNDLVPSDRHVVLAWGRDYDDVSPVKGVTLGGGTHTVQVSVEVKPVTASASGI
jgi:transglutaminase-like putative cysteine protease